jgi:pimeloyl-ACP methyl ester carboxylesterase
VSTSAPQVPLLNIESAGEGGPPLVLLHGFGASSRFWRRWVPALSDRTRVLSVDFTGFGRAVAPPDAALSPPAQAERVGRLLDQLDPAAPILVGHSFGAGVAALASLDRIQRGHPVLPAGLVFMSGAVYPQRIPPFMTLGRMPVVGDLMLAMTPPRFALRLGLRGIVSVKSAVTAETVEEFRKPLESFARRRSILRASRELDMAAAHGIAERIHLLRIPTLLLWGEEDPVIRCEQGRRLAREMPSARLVTRPGVGHLPIHEDGDWFLEHLLAFVEEVRQGQARTRASEAST